MKIKIKIDYNKIINHSEEKILQALKDFKSYPLWWSKKFKIQYFFKKKKNILVFSPVPTINITWEVNIDNNVVNTKYKKGPVKGYGVFKTEKITDTKTKVYYNITVSPRTKLIKTIPTALVSIFKQVHLYHMKQLFNNLNKYLN